jgi:hypothetical protein
MLSAADEAGVACVRRCRGALWRFLLALPLARREGTLASEAVAAGEKKEKKAETLADAPLPSAERRGGSSRGASMQRSASDAAGGGEGGKGGREGGREGETGGKGTEAPRSREEKKKRRKRREARAGRRWER